MNVTKILEAITVLSLSVWAVFTEWRLRSAQFKLLETENALKEQLVKSKVETMPDAVLKSYLDKDLG